MAWDPKADPINVKVEHSDGAINYTFYMGARRAGKSKAARLSKVAVEAFKGKVIDNVSYRVKQPAS